MDRKRTRMFGSLALESALAVGSQAVPLSDWNRGDDGSLCTRLTPPPIPPWLLDSPEKLRHVVANCSAWQTYSKLCAESLRSNYPALWTFTQMGGSHEADGVQWIPTAIVLTFTCILLTVALCGYFRYRRASICKFKQWRSAKYQEQLTPSTSRDYCSPGLSLTPSVTVETQLSLWALEDNIPFNVHGAFTLDADPSLAILTSSPATSSWSVNTTGNNYSSSDTTEVLLQPQRLAETQLPLVDFLPDTSVRGHPVDTYPTLELGPSQCNNRDSVVAERYSKLPVRDKYQGAVITQDWNETDATFQRSSQRELFSGKPKDLKSLHHPQALLKTCQNAGAKLVNKLSRRPNSGKSKSKPSKGTGQKIEASISRLRKSLSDSRLSKSRRQQSQKAANDQISPTSANIFRPNNSTSDISSSQFQSRHYENVPNQQVGSSNLKAGVNDANTGASVSSSLPVGSTSNDAIYSYAAAIPIDSGVSPRTRTKGLSNFFVKRPRFLKNHKFFKKT